MAAKCRRKADGAAATKSKERRNGPLALFLELNLSKTTLPKIFALKDCHDKCSQNLYRWTSINLNANVEVKMPMALFIMYHKWKREETKLVAKKVIEALAQVPEGTALVSSYMRADQTGAVCIWQARTAEQIQDYIRKMVPEMETDVVPALQFFPPAADIYSVMHSLIS